MDEGYLDHAYEMTSKERINILTEDYIYEEVLAAEIEHRTGVSKDVIEKVVDYELENEYEYIQDWDYVPLSLMAEDISNAYPNIDYKTAYLVLCTEDAIFWECCINQNMM